MLLNVQIMGRAVRTVPVTVVRQVGGVISARNLAAQVRRAQIQVWDAPDMGPVKTTSVKLGNVNVTHFGTKMVVTLQYVRTTALIMESATQRATCLSASVMKVG